MGNVATSATHEATPPYTKGNKMRAFCAIVLELLDFTSRVPSMFCSLADIDFSFVCEHPELSTSRRK